MTKTQAKQFRVALRKALYADRADMETIWQAVYVLYEPLRPFPADHPLVLMRGRLSDLISAADGAQVKLLEELDKLGLLILGQKARR